MTKTDAEMAAGFRPKRADILDAMIAASAKRYDASVWTNDKDFLKFLPENRVRVF
jgi:predicted nucleic acid-binding protein